SDDDGPGRGALRAVSHAVFVGRAGHRGATAGRDPRLRARADSGFEPDVGRDGHLAAEDGAAHHGVEAAVFLFPAAGVGLGGRVEIRCALAADRRVERHVPDRQRLPGDRDGDDSPEPAARLVRGRGGARRSGGGMPELLEPADPGRGSGPLTGERGAASGERRAESAPPSDRITTAALPAPRVTLPAPALPAAEPVVLFEQVSKWYGPVIGVNQVTLELRPGGITGLVGANGAGKSTLMRLATGQLRPDLGSVQVRGHDVWQAEAKRHVGYSPDVDSFYEEMSGRQFVETMARLCGFSRGDARQRTAGMLELVGMAGQAERRLRGYSKGMRQRIKVAQALVHDPEVLILDEPLSGIDPIGRQEFLTLFRTLSARGKCLLVSSHELEELE